MSVGVWQSMEWRSSMDVMQGAPHVRCEGTGHAIEFGESLGLHEPLRGEVGSIDDG